MNKIINGKTYKEVDKISTVIPDCFVKTNKLVTEANKTKSRPSSGESRIYVSSLSWLKNTNFFKFPNYISYLKNTFDSSDSDICFFEKNNLLEYLEEAHCEYTDPTINFFYDISVDYEAYLKEVNSLDTIIPFTIFNHKGSKDTARFYINSLDDIWTLFRKLSLPQISYLNIYKLQSDDGDILYFFELKLKDTHISRKVIEREEVLEEEIKNNTDIKETDRIALTKARNGQGKFRNNVISIMKACPFTGITDRTLLRASHIKPWADCSDNHQRLDGYNGLALTPTYDVLFDKGLISFTNDGSLLISSLLSNEVRNSLNLSQGKVYDIANSTGERNNYLEYHREIVFKK